MVGGRVDATVIRIARLVAAKDLRIEARSRVLLWQVLPFGVIALLLAGLALGPTQAGNSSAGPGLFYLVTLFVTLLMINRIPGPGERAGHPGVGRHARARSGGGVSGQGPGAHVWNCGSRGWYCWRDRSWYCTPP